MLLRHCCSYAVGCNVLNWYDIFTQGQHYPAKSCDASAPHAYHIRGEDVCAEVPLLDLRSHLPGKTLHMSLTSPQSNELPLRRLPGLVATPLMVPVSDSSCAHFLHHHHHLPLVPVLLVLLLLSSIHRRLSRF